MILKVFRYGGQELAFNVRGFLVQLFRWSFLDVEDSHDDMGCLLTLRTWFWLKASGFMCDVLLPPLLNHDSDRYILATA